MTSYNVIICILIAFASAGIMSHHLAHRGITWAAFRLSLALIWFPHLLKAWERLNGSSANLTDNARDTGVLLALIIGGFLIERIKPASESRRPSDRAADH
jgi:hypothetical protein